MFVASPWTEKGKPLRKYGGFTFKYTKILYLYLYFSFNIPFSYNNTFRFSTILKDDNTRWRCTVKTCKAYLKYDVDDDIVELNVDHNHFPVPEKNSLRTKNFTEMTFLCLMKMGREIL